MTALLVERENGKIASIIFLYITHTRQMLGEVDERHKAREEERVAPQSNPGAIEYPLYGPGPLHLLSHLHVFERAYVYVTAITIL